MEGDVERAQVELDSASLLDEAAEPRGERNAARVDADEGHGVEALVSLDQLVRDAGKSPVDRLGVEQKLRRRTAREVRTHSVSFPASLDRLKGFAGV